MIGRIWALAIVCAASTFAQTQTTPAKPLAFEVISIRQNVDPHPRPGPPVFGPTADGYRLVNQPLFLVLMTAYVPQSGSGALFSRDVQSMPEWVREDRYDIDAKVSEADMAEWQKPGSQSAMLRTMLQAMLADRFKLIVHREMKEVSVYHLVVAKNGPKLKESTPDEPHPHAAAIPGGGGFMSPGDGGQKVQFYDTNLATFVSIMSNLADRPIQDKTGLSGRYDISFQKPTAPTIFSTMEQLGLKLESAKGEVETLVVDHVERPSDN